MAKLASKFSLPFAAGIEANVCDPVKVRRFLDITFQKGRYFRSSELTGEETKLEDNILARPGGGGRLYR